jgi:hypothetical protein
MMSVTALGQLGTGTGHAGENNIQIHVFTQDLSALNINATSQYSSDTTTGISSLLTKEVLIHLLTFFDGRSWI